MDPKAYPDPSSASRNSHPWAKKLIILSNTSSPSQTALNKLPKLGFDPDLFIGAVTSGEEAGRYIKETYGTCSRASSDGHGRGRVPLVKKAIWFTWADPAVPMAFLSKCGNVQSTTNVDDADFVIAHGCNVVKAADGTGNDNILLGDFMKSADFTVIDPILEQCRRRGLPMVCANPDLIVKLPGDITAHMPGKIAQKYEAMGGDCTYFGKPHAEHFEACLRDLGLDPSKVAHVGDSLHHDIAGANDAGISSIFITGGIHCDDFDCDCKIGEMPPEDSLKQLFEKEKHTPTYVAPLFQF